MFGPIPWALLVLIVSHRWSRVEACSVSTSSSWPVDCSQRGYFIVLDSQNATILTSTLYNTIYNPKTSNTTTWTSARRMAFNSYNNTVQNVTVDNTIYPTMTSKLNKIVSTFIAYSSNDCNWQAYFYSIPLLLGGCQWGSIGDFVSCGNATTNYTLPTTSAPPSCGSSTASMAASTPTSKVSSTSTATTPSSASTGSTSTSSSSTSTSQSTTTTFISSSNSSSNSSASCKLITSSNWPVDCSQRGYLISLDSTSNATMFTTIVYNTVYNVSSSNQTVWTFARRSSFNSYWNSMHNILWNTTTTISERMNSLVYLLSNYSTNDCTWQAQFFATSLTMADGCTWGSIGDFLACGSASSNYSLPVTTASPSSCAFGNGGSGGGGGVTVSGGGGVTVGGGGGVTVSGGGNGGNNATVNGQTITVNGQTATVNGVTVSGQMATATESANTETVKNVTISGMTASSNVSLFTILSNVSAVTESSLNLTLAFDNTTETMTTKNTTAASSSIMTTECVTIAYYTSTVNGTTLSIPMSSMASSTSTGSTTMSMSVGTQTSTDSSTASSTSMSTSVGSSSSMASSQSTMDVSSSTDMSSKFSSIMSSSTSTPDSSTTGSSSSTSSTGSTGTTGGSTSSGSTAGTASTPSIVYVTVCGNTTTTP